MMRKTFQGALGLALGLFVGIGTAGATTLFKAELDTLTRSSDVIVRGTVKQIQSRWTADHLRIVTDVDIEVAEALKGSPERVVRVVQPGGEVGDIGQRVSGLASFASGEEVVVFLQRRGGPSYQVSGMAQGKFRVERSTDGTSAFAIPEPLGDAQLLDPVSRAPVSASARVVELGEFRRQVRAELKADPAGKRNQR